MGANRKLKRARSSRTAAPRARTPTRKELRRQSSAERFARPGSDRLWAALLGWDDARLRRIRLVDAVHDGALWRRAASGVPPFDPAGVIAALASHEPGVAARLTTADVVAAIESWLGDDDADAGPFAQRWRALAELSSRLDLGTPAEELHADWEAWTGMAVAAPARAVLLELLQQAEQASLTVNEVARSETFDALARVLRAAWAGVAYGDRAALDRLRSFAEETR